MNKFYESPIFGFGYSQDYYEYADLHVGNQTLLLNGGIIGFFIFMFFWLYFSYKLQIRSRLSGRKDLKVYIIGLIGILIINSASLIFSYSISVSNALFQSLLFSFANFYYWDSKPKKLLLNKNA